MSNEDFIPAAKELYNMNIAEAGAPPVNGLSPEDAFCSGYVSGAAVAMSKMTNGTLSITKMEPMTDENTDCFDRGFFKRP